MDMDISPVKGARAGVDVEATRKRGRKAVIPSRRYTKDIHLLLTPEEGNGIVCAFSYFQEVDTAANKAFLER
ncbi:MAG: hypothetical protein QXU62_05640, partial [Thermofilaceae archaeon]